MATEPLPVVVLAAGRGMRLGRRAADVPKCLLGIDDTTPLDSLLDALGELPVREILLVVGHRAERVEEALRGRALPWPVRLIPNPDFATRNNIHSAWLARSHARRGFVLVNSDVLAHRDVIRLGFEPGSHLVVDPARPPRDEAMKVRLAAGRLVTIAKELDPASSDGEYVGILRLEGNAAGIFFEALGRRLEAGQTGQWYEAALADICARVPIGARSLGTLPWIEIDDAADLERARLEILPRIRGAAE